MKAGTHWPVAKVKRVIAGLLVLSTGLCLMGTAIVPCAAAVNDLDFDSWRDFFEHTADFLGSVPGTRMLVAFMVAVPVLGGCMVAAVLRRTARRCWRRRKQAAAGCPPAAALPYG